MGVYGGYPTLFFEGRPRTLPSFAYPVGYAVTITEESPVVITNTETLFFLQDLPDIYQLSGR